MHTFELEPLLTALPGDAPCGADLVYDPAFTALEEAAKGKPEQQYGDTIIAAVEPDWRQVKEQALRLAGRTRDLRIAVWLLRSSTRLDGVLGAATGFELLQGLLERHWPLLHPQLDASDHDDPTERLNALAPLTHPAEVLADLRAARLASAPIDLRLRDLELVFNRAEPSAGETVLSEDGALQALLDAEARTPGLLDALQTLQRCARAIDQQIDSHVSAGLGPDLVPLQKLLHGAAEAARRAAAGANDPAAAPAPSAAAPNQNTPSSPVAARVSAYEVGAISSREDAVRALGRISDWIERNEPSNPAPLLIKRAQRLMSKNFLDIIRDLVPDGLDQIERLAGLDRE
ncbi:MAG: type VI secretion system protein TssA [Leptothrix sp. (in: b-proteobacteria)]